MVLKTWLLPALLAGALLCVAPAWPDAPKAPAPPSDSPAANEIELIGTVQSASAQAGQLDLTVTDLVLPGGKQIHLDPARPKTVLTAHAQLAGRQNEALSLLNLKPGWVVYAIGPNNGAGSAMPARVVGVQGQGGAAPSANAADLGSASGTSTPRSLPAPDVAGDQAARGPEGTDPGAPSVGPTESPAQDRAARIVAFCQAHLGQQVGDGECATLVVAALRAVEARTAYDYQDYPGADDYVWGKLVYAAAAENGRLTEEHPNGGNTPGVKPGDIVQYRNALFETVTHMGNLTHWSTVSDPHHTAVISKVSPDGLTWTTLEQNSAGHRYVVEGSLCVTGLKAGWLRVYRPEHR